MAKRKFVENGWEQIPNPPLRPRFEREPLYFANIPTNSSPKDIFLALLGQPALEHLVDMLNSHVHFSTHPNLPIEKVEMVKYIGMHIFLQLRTDVNIHDIFKKGIKEDGFLGKHRFDFIHHHRVIDPEAFYTLVNRSTTSHCCGNIGLTHMCVDELISPWKGRASGVVTYTPRKPHPHGIDFWLTCSLSENGRPFCIKFKPRTTAGADYSHQALMRELLAPLFGNNRGHLTVDALFDTKYLRSLFADQQNHFYTISGHSSRPRYLWGVVHSHLPQSEGYVTFQNNNTGEIITSVLDNKLFNTRSTFFTIAGRVTSVRKSPSTSPLHEEYKSSFNTVDLFNRLFYAHYWDRRTLTEQENLFDSIIQIVLVNSFTIYTNITNNCGLPITEYMRLLYRDLIKNI